MFNQNGFNGPQYPQFGCNPNQFGFNPNQFVPSTNKCFVRSLEEALSRPADFNSQNIYFDVDKNFMYDICTNGRGEKSWAVFEFALKQTSNSQQSSSDDINARFARLESKLEEFINGKHDAQSTDTGNASTDKTHG